MYSVHAVKRTKNSINTVDTISEQNANAYMDPIIINEIHTGEVMRRNRNHNIFCLLSTYTGKR